MILLLLACSEEAPPGFTLRLTLLLADNQEELFDGLDGLTATITGGDGSEASFDLGEPQANSTRTADGLPPLDGATVTLEGYQGTALGAWGRSDGLELSAGEINRNVFFSATNAVAHLPEAVAYGMEVAPLGGGRFLLAGGKSSQNGGEASSAYGVLDLSVPDQDFELVDEGALLPAVEDGMGETTTPLSYEGRFGHTLTAVEDGILMIGGGGGYLGDPEDWTTAAAFLYRFDDPHWEAVAEMSIARNGHIAIRNQDGNVVVWGGIATGYGYADPPKTFEFYAPNDEGELVFDANNMPGSSPGLLDAAGVELPGGEGTFICGGSDLADSGTGSFDSWEAQAGCVRIDEDGKGEEDEALLVPRTGMAMVVIDDTRVLMTGGALVPDVQALGGQVDASSGAYIYNLLGNEGERWGSLATGMNIARAGHQMVPLPDGRVLIIGGSPLYSFLGPPSGTGALCPEIYDPEGGNSGTFTLLPGCDEEGEEDGALVDTAWKPSVASDPDYGVLISNRIGDGSSYSDLMSFFNPARD